MTQSPLVKGSRSLVCVWQQQLAHVCSLIWEASIAVDLRSPFWPDLRIGVTSSLALSSDRHRLVLSYVWMLPQLSHAKPLVRGVASGSAVITDKEMHERSFIIALRDDSHGNVIAPFSSVECLPIRSDNTIQEVRWKNAEDLSTLAGRPVRFRFHLRDGSLYSFW